MKDIIVIEEDFWVKHFQEREIEFQEEDMCSGGNPEEWWHYKKEQVPETWEELLELCKKFNNKKVEIIFVDIRIIIHLDDDCEISFTDTFKDIWFKKKNFEVRIKTKLTPAQMYQIIKNLIGEE